MEYAMQLLLERKLPIGEVARASGYERQASFTSAFKAHYGLLPKAARQLQSRSRDADL
jgi:AraC-like DNA-binding protein